MNKYPAVNFGISILFGISLFLYPHVILMASSLMWISYQAFNSLSRGFLILLLMAASYAYVQTYYLLPAEDVLEGNGIFSPDSVTFHKTHFGPRWVYKGYFSHFVDAVGGDIRAKNIPVTISLSALEKDKKLDADHSYLVAGKLKRMGPSHYVFVPGKNESWVIVDEPLSFVEWRFRAKKCVSDYIAKQVRGKVIASFLSGLVTGVFDDRVLSFELGRFGVQHVMAISGFHFGILAAIFGSLLRLFCGIRLSSILLVLCLTSYFLFIGISASVLRAWVAISLSCLGLILGKRVCPVNLLGVGLVVVLIHNPLTVNTIGFQYSFLATAAILLGYKPSDRLLSSWIPQRSLRDVIPFSILDQHLYWIVTTFRKALALTLVVHIATVPLTLHHFHKFPLLSLAYNLFFPFLASLCMGFSLLASAFSWVPIIGGALWLLTERVSEWALGTTFHMPPQMDYLIRSNACSAEWVIAYTALILSLLMVLNTTLCKDGDEETRFLF